MRWRAHLSLLRDISCCITFSLVILTSIGNLCLNAGFTEYVKGVNTVETENVHFDRAQLWLTLATRLGEDSKAADLMGRIHIWRGQLDKAIVAWQKSGLSIDHFVNVAQAYALTNPQLALDAFEALTEMEPQSGAPWFYLGLQYSDMKSYSNAINSLERALDSDNWGNNVMTSDVFYHLGLAHRAQNNSAAAYRAFDRAVMLDAFSSSANKVNALWRKGEMLVWMGRYTEAAEPLQRAIHIKPDLYNAYSLLGVVAYQQGNIKDATSSWEKAISIEPKYVWSYIHMARMYRDLGEKSKAVAYYRQALTIEPQNQVALRELSELEK